MDSMIRAELKKELKAEIYAELKQELKVKIDRQVAREIARLKDELRAELSGTGTQDPGLDATHKLAIEGVPSANDNERQGMSTMNRKPSFARRLSFTRKSKPKSEPVNKEIDIHKETAQERLGMILSGSANQSVTGVVVSEIEAGSKLDKHRKLKPGDCIHSVNGTPVNSVADATELLRTSKGVILLSISRRPLPPDWRQKYVVIDGTIKIWYRNKRDNLSMFSHPFANDQRKADVNEHDDATDSEEEFYDMSTRRRESVSDAIVVKQGLERGASFPGTSQAHCGATQSPSLEPASIDRHGLKSIPL
mmetsp:Transcript_69155/g.114962  ORF Transcript_69155/g.114962 Transcript_69155/m.114962 type:complete len:307 (+) Transcript_69155:3-923(+)